jgi:GNAT superfamily N-acetyltransferase
MKNSIKILLREGLMREDIETLIVDDIDDDDTYNSLIKQSKELLKSGEISFGQADLFGALVDGSILIGATWADVSGTFSFHIQIKPEYRNKGYSKLLLDDLFTKYKQMLSYRGEDFKMRVNVVNDNLAKSLSKHYGLKVIEDNGSHGVIMGN